MAQPCFVIVQFDVKDFAQYFADYGSKLGALAAKHGGEFLAATPNFVVKEGVAAGNFTAILRFPSAEQAQALYESEDYAPLKAKRIDELTHGGQVFFVPGLDKAA